MLLKVLFVIQVGQLVLKIPTALNCSALKVATESLRGDQSKVAEQIAMPVVVEQMDQQVEARSQALMQWEH
jgi:hypothetical protein